MLASDVNVSVNLVREVVQVLEREKTLLDGLGRQKLSVPCEPIHPVHLPGHWQLILADLLSHIDCMFIDKALHEGPNLAHLFGNLGHGVAVERRLTAPLERYTIHVLDIRDLLLKK